MTSTGRVSSGQVVRSPEIIISGSNTEKYFFSPSQIIEKKTTGLDLSGYIGGLFVLPNSDLPDAAVLEDLSKNTIHMTDIEEIQYYSYLSTTGELKYKAVLKIRNSSVNKEEVIGVDARIPPL